MDHIDETDQGNLPVNCTSRSTLECAANAAWEKARRTEGWG